MLEVTIRRMREEDISDIMETESVSFGTYHWSTQAFANEIKNPLGYYFVAENKETGKVIGYCGFWLIEKEAHITTIAVNPDFRQHKLGEHLLQKMIKHGYDKDAKWFTLEVRISNIAAQELYKKYEFESLGTRKRYYQDNDEDALIMWTENIWDEKFKKRFKELEEKLQTQKN